MILTIHYEMDTHRGKIPGRHLHMTISISYCIFVTNLTLVRFLHGARMTFPFWLEGGGGEGLIQWTTWGLQNLITAHNPS